MRELSKLNVSAVFARSKGAVKLRGALTFDALTEAKALLEPLLPVVKPPRKESSTSRFQQRIHANFHSKQQRGAADSVEILPIDSCMDEDAVTTWTESISPNLSKIFERAEINYPCTVTLVRQRDALIGPIPVIRFQSRGQTEVERQIIQEQIKYFCSQHGRSELPVHFYSATMVTLVGNSFADDPPDNLIVPRQSRYYQQPGMSASIGMSQCEHSFATLGGYVLVGGRPFMLTVWHLIEDASACGDCRGSRAIDHSVDSPAPADVIALTRTFDKARRTFSLQIEHSDLMPAEDEVSLDDLSQVRTRTEFTRMDYYNQWREELIEKDSEDFKLGRLVESSDGYTLDAPFYRRENDSTVKSHCFDWAIFQVEQTRLGRNKFRYPRGIELDDQHFEEEAESLDGIGEICEGSREFRPNETVFYFGSKSYYREGIINQIPVRCMDSWGRAFEKWSILLQDTIEVKVDDVKGDSGAWIFAKSDNHVLGLLRAFDGKQLLFTPIREVFHQISSKMGNLHVEVLHLDRPRAPLPVATPISGRKGTRTARTASEDRVCSKRLLDEEEARAEQHQHALLEVGIRSPNEKATVTGTSTPDQSLSRSPSPVPSLTSSEASFSDSHIPDPSSPGTCSSDLPLGAWNLDDTSQGLKISTRPLLFMNPPSPNWNCHPSQLLEQSVRVEA